MIVNSVILNLVVPEDFSPRKIRISRRLGFSFTGYDGPRCQKKAKNQDFFSHFFYQASHSMEVSNRDRTVVKSVTAKVYLYPLDEIQISRHQPETLF